MKKPVKILFMILIGVVFLPMGIWLNNQLIANPYKMPPYALVNLICLVLWLNISFLMKSETTDTKTVVISMNVIPVIVLLLNIYRHFVLQSYEGTLGLYIQLYFQPIMWLNFNIFSFSRAMVSLCLNSVLTLVLCSFIGCKAKEGFLRIKEAWS